MDSGEVARGNLIPYLSKQRLNGDCVPCSSIVNGVMQSLFKQPKIVTDVNIFTLYIDHITLGEKPAPK